MDHTRSRPFVVAPSAAFLLLAGVAPALLLAPPHPPRQHLPALPKNGQGWKPTKVTPEALAARIDRRMARLKNAIAVSYATIDLPTGSGRARMRSVWQSPNQFRVEIVRLGSRRYEEVRKTTFQLEKGSFRVLLDAGWLNRSLPGYAQTPQPVLNEFTRRFDDVLFRGVRGAKPIEALVTAARRAKWRVSSEANPRLAPPMLRIRLEAPDGKKVFAIDVDERRDLVTQIWSEDDSAGKTPLRILWTSTWGIKATPLTEREIREFDPTGNGGIY